MKINKEKFTKTDNNTGLHKMVELTTATAGEEIITSVGMTAK